jgi:hypothetical protein
VNQWKTLLKFELNFNITLEHAVAYLIGALYRKVANKIPDEYIRFFNLSNPFICTMTLGLTEPLTKMSTSNLRGRESAAGA